jgi:hypothetical protein
MAQLPLSAMHLQFLESEKTRPVTPVPRWWSPDPGAVLRDIAGRDLDAAYLEAVVPVHRLAHVALDKEGRQVGEVNSFPEILRLKVPTEWKTCNYAGTRYHDDTPMNMTALRSMIAHWKPVLRATLLFREEFLRRYPQLPDGHWKLGELHFLSSGILALPALQLLRGRDPVRNGDLDPVLSSLFRVTDGVRMVCAHLLDLHRAQMLHDHPVRPRDITDAAERERQYQSAKGVCAGPQAMIDEFLATLMDGKPVQGDGGEPGAWTADIPRALDYALLGLRVYASVFSVWVRMGLAWTRIREALLRAPQPGRGRLERLRAAMERDWPLLVTVGLDQPEQRAWVQGFYERMFHHAGRGIRAPGADGLRDLSAELTPPSGLLGERAEGALRDLFASGELPEAAVENGPVLEAVAGHVLDYLRFERNALRTVTVLQREISLLLERPQPSSPLTGSQLAIHHILRKGTRGGIPYLLDPVSEALEISVENQKDATTIFHGGRSLTLT